MKLPEGFLYAATYAGIRKVKKDDLALIVSETPASAAAMFTTNDVKAAPVVAAQRRLRATRGRVRALLINAGNANCATRTGEAVVEATTAALAKKLGCPVEQVIPASTGVIGVELDARLILNALPALTAALSPAGFTHVSRAIMTTDQVPKVACAEVPFPGGQARIAGMTKGAGMIHPRLATTLGFVMTDAAIAPHHLKPMLAAGIERSYHRLSVDGDTSTNDMVIVLANGASGWKPDEKGRKVFAEVLAWLLEDLAEMIAADGEGARKLITIHVEGARNEEMAERVARAVANSPLVKTAIAGADPNWGRILSAAGTAGVRINPSKVDVFLQGVKVCSGGVAAEYPEQELVEKLSHQDVHIRLHLHAGKAETRFFTCDLTEGYIRINGSYRT